MPVPRVFISALSYLSLAGALLFAVTPASAARNPEPSLRLRLEDFGFQPLSQQFLLAGSSMLTIHFVDDQHLLLTFSARHLLPRLPDEPEDDRDRTIDAVFLELPSGHILARTTWRTHDHGQYLWNLGHGHFLLRIRDTLTTFAPLLSLPSGQAFAEHPFLTADNRRIAAVVLSPDADLLTVETIKRTPPAPKPKTPLFGPTPPAPDSEPTSVQINFYRLHLSADSGETIKSHFAGVALAKGTGGVPATTAGYLATIDQGHQHYAFDFHSYTGKVDELAPFDSSCHPFPLFVSHSEFLAFGCHSGQTIGIIGGFNMRGQEMWEQGLFGDFIAPSLTFAPSSGRFAMSRILLHGNGLPDQPVSADEISSQTVVVYQTDSGKQILHADCSPVERAGQNFALSPDGLALALIHADAIEIYRLPPLTGKEENAVKLAQTSAPPENDLPIYFVNQPTPSAEEADSTVQPEAQPANAVVPASAAPPTTPAPSTEASGDPAPEEHRKPPTLYTLPTDKPPITDRPKDTPQ